MKRTIVLSTLVAVGLSITLAAQRGPAPAGRGARPTIEVNKLADNLFVLAGGGGNTAVFVTASGVVLVDTKVAEYGAPVLAAVKQITSKPVVMVINTHLHPDHVLGQLQFPPKIEYVSQENTKRGMQAMPEFSTPENADKLPTRTFKERLSLLSGRDRIELYYFGAAHTAGDAWVVFPAAGVMHAGDVVPGKQVPLVDTATGGSGVSYPVTLARAYRTVKNVKTVITGHGGTMTWAEVGEYVDFNRELLAWANAEMKAGKTPEAARAEYHLPPRFANYEVGSPGLFGSMPVYLNSVYAELSRK